MTATDSIDATAPTMADRLALVEVDVDGYVSGRRSVPHS